MNQIGHGRTAKLRRMTQAHIMDHELESNGPDGSNIALIVFLIIGAVLLVPAHREHVCG